MLELSRNALSVLSVGVADYDKPWKEAEFGEPNMGIHEGKYPWVLLEAVIRVLENTVEETGRISLNADELLLVRYYPERAPNMFGVFDWRVRDPVMHPTRGYVPPYIGATLLSEKRRKAIPFNEEEKLAIANLIEDFLRSHNTSGDEMIFLQMN